MPKSPDKPFDFEQINDMNSADVARFFDMKRQNIVYLVNEGGPKKSNGKFNLPEFTQWYISRLKEDNTPKDIRELDKKKRTEEIEKLKLANAQKRNELVPAESVEEVLTERARSLSSFLPRALLENAGMLSMRPVEELQPILREISIQAMETYTGQRKGG